MYLPGFSSRDQTTVEKTREALTKALDVLPISRRRTTRERVWPPLARFGAGLATTTVALTAYRYGVLPWHRTWGATDAEVEMSLPGDGLVPKPAYQTTRAITIDTPPEAVWPWLVQMGQERAGFYSYDWLETLFGLEIQNADRVHPEWQNLEVGDTVRLAPADQYSGHAEMRVVHFDPHRALVFGPVVETPDDLEAAARTGAGTWAFVLSPTTHNQTRLIVRTRSRSWTASRLAFHLYDPAHFLMERKMLLGLQERAEAHPEPPVQHAPPTDDETAPADRDARRKTWGRTTPDA
jgi:hypothetical protein